MRDLDYVVGNHSIYNHKMDVKFVLSQLSLSKIFCKCGSGTFSFSLDAIVLSNLSKWRLIIIEGYLCLANSLNLFVIVGDDVHNRFLFLEMVDTRVVRKMFCNFLRGLDDRLVLPNVKVFHKWIFTLELLLQCTLILWTMIKHNLETVIVSKHPTTSKVIWHPW